MGLFDPGRQRMRMLCRQLLARHLLPGIARVDGLEATCRRCRDLHDVFAPHLTRQFPDGAYLFVGLRRKRSGHTDSSDKTGQECKLELRLHLVLPRNKVAIKNDFGPSESRDTAQPPHPCAQPPRPFPEEAFSRQRKSEIALQYFPALHSDARPVAFPTCRCAIRRRSARCFPYLPMRHSYMSICVMQKRSDVAHLLAQQKND
jgi:hypothetical protein